MHPGFQRVALIVAMTSALTALVSCKSTPRQSAANPVKPLNVVLITLDTVRADHLNCYGYKKIKTPAIDAIAAHGVLFVKALTQAPVTAPSHASMFTGTNPNVHRVRDNGFALQPSSVTLATILRRQGWDTAAFVSTSILGKHFGLGQGFSTYDDQMPPAGNGQHEATRPGNVAVDHAIEWLRVQKSQPFFLWVHLYDAHLPYRPHVEFSRQYPGDPYDAEIAFEDQQVGRLLAAIRRKSPAGKTMIVLLSDHGESLGQHGEYEHGIFLYDSTLHIAWMMSGPGIPAGVRVRQQAREIDLLPTILDLLGAKASPAIQGTSMVPAFYGKSVPSTYSYEETLIPKIDMGWTELRGIHTAHWMYIRAPRPELYNLDRDPDELNNVIDTRPKEYRELDAELRQLSGIGVSGRETVTMKQLDRPTMEQLQSLGYVADFSARKVELNGKGDDPKDHLATLKTLQTISDTKGISDARQIKLLRQALKADPANPTLYSWLIEAYEHSGQYPQAIQACLDALHYHLHEGEMLSGLAGLYLRQGNVQEAISYYQRAAQLNPLDVEGQNDLATAYLQSGRLVDAERTFRWVLTIQPYAPAYNGLGILADKRNDVAGARRNFERAVRLDPAYIEAQLNLGTICAQAHDFPCAINAFRAFIANAPKNSKEYGPELTKVKAALALLEQRQP
ncbi:MAG: sulfatase-like hydrolase/transferase [Acidobacteriaceae bacterium]